MPTPNQSNVQPNVSKPPAAKKIEEGIWMYYDAAALATGKSEKTLKRYVKKGELKARRVGNQVNSPVQVWITPAFQEAMGNVFEQVVDDPDIFETESDEAGLEAEDILETTIAQGPDMSGQTSPRATDAYETMVKLMVSEFASQLDRKQDLLVVLQKELETKEQQLRLLPDLQRKLEEKEKEAHIQTVALEKQIEAMKENLLAEKTLAEALRVENDRLKQEADAAKSRKSWLSWLTGS